MSIRFPRLLDGNLNEVRTIYPADGTLSLTAIPLSTATLTLEEGESIPVRSWIRMYCPSGASEVFRVRTISNSYGANACTVEMDHAITELSDFVCSDSINEELSLSSAISRVFGYYNGSKWRLGANTATDRVVIDISFDNVLEAILGLLQQAPDYVLSFNFNSTPWTINVVRRDTVVSAEGRLTRNVAEASVSYDDSELCTRAFVDWESSSGNTHSSHTSRYDADTIGTYGVIERHLPGSGYTEGQAEIVARTYLSRHKKPAVSIVITGYDFSSVTGEPLDAVSIGKLYRLAVPKYNVVVEENITSLTWSHLYSNPDEVEITLGEAEDPVVSFIRQQNSVAKGASSAVVKKSREYWTKFEQTDYYIDMVAAHADKNGTILEKAGLYLDATGALIYADDGDANKLAARFRVQKDAIDAEVRNRERSDMELSGQIRVEAGKITQIVQAVGKDGEVTAASIVLAINEAGESEAHIDANKVYIGTKKSKVYIDGEIEKINATYIQGKIAQISVVNVNGLNSTNNVVAGGYIMAPVFYIGTSGNAKSFDNVIVSASVSGNTLTLHPLSGSDVTFSKATTLDGAWSSGKLTVTASPQGATFERTLDRDAISWDNHIATIPVIAKWGNSLQYSQSTGKNFYVDASDEYEVTDNQVGVSGLAIKPSTESIGGRYSAGSVSKSSIAAPGYLFFQVTVHGHTKKYYITVNT